MGGLTVALDAQQVVHPTTAVPAVKGTITLDEKRPMNPFRIVVELFSADSTPTRKTIEYTRNQIEEMISPSYTLPDWAWRD
jgi:hypothetical protein